MGAPCKVSLLILHCTLRLLSNVYEASEVRAISGRYMPHAMIACRCIPRQRVSSSCNMLSCRSCLLLVAGPRSSKSGEFRARFRSHSASLADSHRNLLELVCRRCGKPSLWFCGEDNWNGSSWLWSRDASLLIPKLDRAEISWRSIGGEICEYLIAFVAVHMKDPRDRPNRLWPKPAR